ncbi:MAG: hypothetical protein DRN20_05690 [Thermoplasmata archaeon]|nr:MAG: hypothetical protein DRN20_05690 [Thermoplasmata archaeon]
MSQRAIKQMRIVSIEGYCIDTSALIDMWRKYYPKDVFPGVWDDLASLIRQKILIAPRQVLDELERREDELLKWAKDHKEMFIEPDEDLIVQTMDVIRTISEMCKERNVRPPALDKTIEEADPFVIALAECRGFIVVSQEKPHPKGAPRIPDICERRCVKHLSVTEFFVRQHEVRGWKYIRE